MAGQFAAGNMSVDTGGEFTKPTFLRRGWPHKIRVPGGAGQFATSVSVGLGPNRAGESAMMSGRSRHRTRRQTACAAAALPHGCALRAAGA
jgi:hypothetical protein